MCFTYTPEVKKTIVKTNHTNRFNIVLNVMNLTMVHTLSRSILFYHASDKIVGILRDKSRSRDNMKITALGVEIRIGCVF